MSVILTILAALIATGACAYHRTNLRTWAVVTIVATLVVGLIAGAPWTMLILLIIELAIAVPLLMVSFRRRNITAPILKTFAKVTPKLSETEQTALEAGTIGFEGELFSGKPNWSVLMKQPKPVLSVE
jgi:acyl-CoA dehydrogenase